MRCPADHEKYFTGPDAQAALRRLVEQAKRTGNGGKSYKRLNVFRCGNHWHVGRSNKLAANYQKYHQKAAPAPKRPSTGKLLRKLERMARQWERQEDYQRRKRAEAIGKLIAAEQAVIDAENEMREVQRQVIGMFFPAQSEQSR